MELHSPFQAFPLMEGTQSCIRVFVVEIDGSSHQQESRIRYINAFCHFLVQISNNCIPAGAQTKAQKHFFKRSWSSRILPFWDSLQNHRQTCPQKRSGYMKLSTYKHILCQTRFHFRLVIRLTFDSHLRDILQTCALLGARDWHWL